MERPDTPHLALNSPRDFFVALESHPREGALREGPRGEFRALTRAGRRYKASGVKWGAGPQSGTAGSIRGTQLHSAEIHTDVHGLEREERASKRGRQRH